MGGPCKPNSTLRPSHVLVSILPFFCFWFGLFCKLRSALYPKRHCYPPLHSDFTENLRSHETSAFVPWLLCRRCWTFPPRQLGRQSKAVEGKRGARGTGRGGVIKYRRDRSEKRTRRRRIRMAGMAVDWMGRTKRRGLLTPRVGGFAVRGGQAGENRHAAGVRAVVQALGGRSAGR